MIIGLGFDLLDIGDFGKTLARSGEPYLNRVYTEQEIAYCRAKPNAGESFAVRFAAKEAAMKALGLAGEDGLDWHDFEVVCLASGQPTMVLRGKAAERFTTLGLGPLLLSLSHSASTAGAIVVAENLDGTAILKDLRTTYEH